MMNIYEPFFTTSEPRSTIPSPKPTTMYLTRTYPFTSLPLTGYIYHPEYDEWHEAPSHCNPHTLFVNKGSQKNSTPTHGLSKSYSLESSAIHSDITPEEAQAISCFAPLLFLSPEILPSHRRQEIRQLEAAYEELEGFGSPEERAIAQATFNLLLFKKEEEERKHVEHCARKERERLLRLQQMRVDILLSCLMENECLPRSQGPPLQHDDPLSSRALSSLDCLHRGLDLTEKSGPEGRKHRAVYHEETHEGHWPPSAPSSPDLPHPSQIFPSSQRPLPQKATGPPPAPLESSPMLPHPKHVFSPQNESWPSEAPPAYMLPDPKVVFGQH